jgi:hypothetical protein
MAHILITVGAWDAGSKAIAAVGCDANIAQEHLTAARGVGLHVMRSIEQLLPYNPEDQGPFSIR